MRILSAIMFFPRGGSAQVVRALACELPDHGWDVTLLSGTLGTGLGDAKRFYAGLDLQLVDFETDDAPMHPSYEDRPGAPDRCFALLDDEEYGAQVHAWSRAMEKAGAAGMDVLHLHHLTPMNEAAVRVAPDVPVIGHLHGTELAMLERIDAGPPDTWIHAEAWARRMRRWAASCSRLIVHTTDGIADASATLMLDSGKLAVVPNGFDPDLFSPAAVDRSQFWRKQLIEDPQGWRPGEPAGSVTYDESEVSVLDSAVVLVAVGRFTNPKRLGLLVRAFEQARTEAKRPLALVLVGGHPGEWEGEHPIDAIEAANAGNVFLAGWRDHAELPEFFNAADLQVLASVREQFGLVLVEGMACALPPIAVNRFGPRSIIEDGRTGWLVEPDDQSELAAAIVDAATDCEERARRGIAGRREALDSYGWPAIAGDVAGLLADAHPTRPGAYFGGSGGGASGLTTKSP
jgi:glycosyltransferase involved in cell wall biosynthesis